MLRRLVVLFVVLAPLVVAGSLASASPCVKTGCRVLPGQYSGKGQLEVGKAGGTARNSQIALNQTGRTALVTGTCDKSDLPAPFPFTDRLDDSVPQWTLPGKAPVIGRTTTYRQKYSEGDSTYRETWSTTVSVKMRTAKAGTVSVLDRYVINSNQEGTGGQYTSKCTGKAKFGVKR